MPGEIAVRKDPGQLSIFPATTAAPARTSVIAFNTSRIGVSGETAINSRGRIT